MNRSAAPKRAFAARTRSLLVRTGALAATILFASVTTAHATIPLPKPRPDTAAIKVPPESKLSDARTLSVPLPTVRPLHRPAWATKSELALAYQSAFDLARKGQWSKLSKQRRSPRDASLETALFWLRLEQPGSKVTFKEVQKFLDARPIWPRRQNLVRRAETLITKSLPLDVRLAWFSSNPPSTLNGRLKWIEALKQAGRADVMAEAVRDTWAKARFSGKAQRLFRRTHRSILDQSMDWRRLDRFLWLGINGSARAMMPLVSSDLRKLAEARLRLRRNSGGVDSAVKRVPNELQSDPGLIYERLRWRNRKGLKDKALELLWDVPGNQEFSTFWWKERSRQLRYALDSGRLDDAYLLAASHIQKSGATFAEAQWHAGWVALRFSGKADEAARYFTTLHEAVKTPISRARAAYWAGRALETKGGQTAAQKWYARAARHQTTFYGQLAGQKIPSTIARLPSTPVPMENAPAGSLVKELVETASALKQAGQVKLARLLLRTSARTATGRDDATWIARTARALGFLDLSVYTARRAARHGHILTDAGYPLIDVPTDDAPEPALTLAVIRQESGFDFAARSRVGALGLMQLMPATARNVARGLKISYGKGRLTADPDYNLRLGTRYLQAQINTFNGYYPLALAAYNAGPHRVKRWLKERGDPRLPGVDMIDWIERIPFAETRNYVQRVLESMQVYRLRLGSPEKGWRVTGTSPGEDQCTNAVLARQGCATIMTANSR